MLANFMEVGGSFCIIYAYQIITYTLNILNFISQLNLNKTGGKSPARYKALNFELWV